MSKAQCNKAELAHALGVSLPTLSRWMLRYGGEFPIEERGSNGRDYVFDFEHVSRFLGEKRGDEQAKRTERDEQLAQLKLSFDLPGVPEPPATARTSPKDELDAWRLRRLQREEAEKAGALVPTEAALGAFSAALSRISRDTHAFLRQVGREQGWPAGYVKAIEDRYADMQRAAVKDLSRQFGAPAAEEPEHALA